jgi:hypothetical protein
MAAAEAVTGTRQTRPVAVVAEVQQQRERDTAWAMSEENLKREFPAVARTFDF